MRQMTWAMVLLAVAAAVEAGPSSMPASKPATGEDVPFKQVLVQLVEGESQRASTVIETLGITGDQAKRMLAHEARRDALIAELKSKRKDEWAAMDKAAGELPDPGLDEAQRMDFAIQRLGKHEKLIREIAAIQHAYVRDLMGELTPEQQLHRYTLHVHDWVSEDEEIAAIELSPEQQREIDSICTAAAREVLALGDARTDARMNEIYNSARKQCREKVLALKKRGESTWGSDKPLK